MRLSRITAAASAAVVIGGAFGGTALAVGSFSLSTSNFLPSVRSQSTTITYSGYPANTTVFVQVCRKDGNNLAPGQSFSQVTDCSSATTSNFTTSGTGAGTAPFDVFVGADPGESPWGCGALAADDGVTAFATCFVRLVPNAMTNNNEDDFLPITFTATPPTTTTTTATVPPAEVPEVPMSVLLPAGAAAVMGGSLFLARRRQRSNNAA